MAENSLNNNKKNNNSGILKLVDNIIDSVEKLLILIFTKIKSFFVFIANSRFGKFIKNIFIFKIISNFFKAIYNKLIKPITTKISNRFKMLINGGVVDVNDVIVGDGSVSSDTFEKTELSEADIAATEAAKLAIIEKKENRVRIIKRIIFFIIFIILIVIIILNILKFRKSQDDKKEVMKQVQTVREMNISSELSGSGTLSPKDSYTITSLVEGEVTEVFFEVGDKVEKGQLLLSISSKNAERSVVNASSSLAQAVDNYNLAKKNYDKLENDYSDNTFKSPFTGYLRTLNVRAGDKISNNKEIAKIVDDTVMELKVPFVSVDANNIKGAEIVQVMIGETGEVIHGAVNSIAEEEQTASNGSLVKYVTILCANPGGLTTDNTGLAIINGTASLASANFTAYTEETITFNDGNDVEIEKMLIKEGARVSKGTPIFKITDDTMDNIISNKKSSYMTAKDNLTKAENNYEDALDSVDEYHITSPISGTVITKNAKVGDKIQRNSNSTTTLATIYDLSELTLDMDVDELDISKVELGQDVNIQADAFNNKNFSGTITNINLVANNSNGVTNYPVTVTIKEVGNLLPGMNVDAYVVLSKVDNAIGIPSDALQRGNVCYVLNSSPTIVSKNYNTEGISDRVKNNTPEGFTAVKVTTGISNENFIQITEGLQVGDQVYVSESSSTNNWQGFGGMGGPMGGGPMGGGNRSGSGNSGNRR